MIIRRHLSITSGGRPKTNVWVRPLAHCKSVGQHMHACSPQQRPSPRCERLWQQSSYKLATLPTNTIFFSFNHNDNKSKLNYFEPIIDTQMESTHYIFTSWNYVIQSLKIMFKLMT